MARLKASVAQIRAQCATDLRRRDGEITRMKKHLEGRRGRDGNSNQVGVVVVTPGMMANRSGNVETDIDSPEYSLKQETTDFLTQLSQTLSDENDALIGLVRGTLSTLKSLQGLPVDNEGEVDLGGKCEGTFDGAGIMVGPPNYEALATSTDDVLEHLRGLLTNPSFVPLEELEIREEEIHRLREGWEMMAERWREAVSLLGGWKKRMTDDGDTIKLEDLKDGLKLRSGMPSAQEARHSPFKFGIRRSLSGGSDDLKKLSAEVVGIHPDESIGENSQEILKTKKATEKALNEMNPNAVPHLSSRPELIPTAPEGNSEILENGEEEVSLLDFATCDRAERSPPKGGSKIPQVSHCNVLLP